MKFDLFDLHNIRFEIAFKSFDELRRILSFYTKNNIYKINIPCKSNLKKDFLLNSIKIAKYEFPEIDLIPHFSILHEFIRNRKNTEQSLIEFIQNIKFHGCSSFLLVSGSQKRITFDTVLALNFLKNNFLLSNNDFLIGVAFNPYLPDDLFEIEIRRLGEKIKSGMVNSIWFQFGTDNKLLERRIVIIKDIVSSALENKVIKSRIFLYGSVLIPSKQFLSRFKYRPWKGVYCSDDFLNSVDSANNIVIQLLKTYKKFDIIPIIETDSSTNKKLYSLSNIFK